MQSFGPLNGAPLQGLVDSRIEIYEGQHRASAQSTAGSLYARRGPMLVSPGCAPQVTWVGQKGGCPGSQVSAFYRFMHFSIPIPHPALFPGLGEMRKAVLGQAPGTLHPSRADGTLRQRARRSQALGGGAVRQV